MVEKIAQILTDLTGCPVSETGVVGALVIGAVSVVAILFAVAWHRSGQIDWEAVEAERRRLEDDY